LVDCVHRRLHFALRCNQFTILIGKRILAFPAGRVNERLLQRCRGLS
jgi:hypothetical protein